MEDVHADELSSLLHTEQRIIEAEALRQVPCPDFALCCELRVAAVCSADRKCCRAQRPSWRLYSCSADLLLQGLKTQPCAVFALCLECELQRCAVP